MSCSSYSVVVELSFNVSMILFISWFAFFFQLINYSFWVFVNSSKCSFDVFKFFI